MRKTTREDDRSFFLYLSCDSNSTIFCLGGGGGREEVSIKTLITYIPQSQAAQLVTITACPLSHCNLFVSTSAEFGISTVVGLNGKPVEDKVCTF
jgi:hypothetical protein